MTEIVLHPFMLSTMKVLSSEVQIALPRLHNVLQDGWSPEKQFLGKMQYAEELQLFHVPSGSLAGKGGACMFYLFVLRGDGSDKAAPDTACCFAWACFDTAMVVFQEFIDGTEVSPMALVAIGIILL